MLCKFTLYFSLLEIHKLSEQTAISIPKKVFWCLYWFYWFQWITNIESTIVIYTSVLTKWPSIKPIKIEQVKLQFISVYTLLRKGRKEEGLRTERHLTFSRQLQIAF